MRFQRSENEGLLELEIGIDPVEGNSISDPANGKILIDVKDFDDVQFPLVITIGESELSFSPGEQLESIVQSPSEFPIEHTFEIPSGSGSPRIPVILNDSGTKSLESINQLAYSEPINLAVEALNNDNREEVIKNIESYYGTDKIWRSEHLKADIEYFVSFEEYVQILDIINENNPHAGHSTPRTLTKRVVKKDGPYSTSSVEDLKHKVDTYSSAENLGDIAVEEVVIEQVYDVFAYSSDDGFDSLLELSSRLGLDEQWHRLLSTYNLDLIISSYYLFSEESLDYIVDKQKSSAVREFRSESRLNQIAKTLHNAARHNENRTPLSSELYKYAANVNSQIGNDHRRKEEIARMNIGKGFHYKQQNDYVQAQDYFEDVLSNLSDIDELRNPFLIAARQQAKCIKNQLDEDGDVRQANENIQTLHNRFVDHPSAQIDREDVILQIKDEIESQIEILEEQKPSGVDTDSETPEQKSRKKVKRSRIKRDRDFAPMVKKVYQNRCAVCGSQRHSPDGQPEVEAAHIRPAGIDDGPDTIKNALALCKLHHWAFDKGWISINDDHSIIVREDPDTNGYSEFAELEGEKLSLPKDDELHPGGKFLQFHREKHGFESGSG